MPRPRVLIDLAPFRAHRDFRLLWSGYLATTLGSQLTVVAIAYQVYRLTGSSLDVGLVSLGQLVPLLVGSLVGGALADRIERRNLLMATQLLLGSTSVGLALNADSAHPALWPLFVCSAASAAFGGCDNTTRVALGVDVVGTSMLIAANAAWQVLFQVAQIVGPAVAGVLLGQVGLRPVYWIDVGSYVVSTALLAFVRHRRAVAAPRGFSLGEVFGGLRYLKGHQVLQAVFLADVNAMVFGMPRALFPALGLGHFRGGARLVGMLYAAPGAGALAGALLAGWAASVRRQGAAVFVAVTVWGAAIVAFGLVDAVVPALVLLALAGAADVFSAIFRSTILQTESPAELRARLQAVQTSVVAGSPRLGDLEAGAVASLAGPVVSVVSGGMACVAGVLVLARLFPRFTAYRTAVDLGAGTEGAPGQEQLA